jgi:PAS domain S-box-containing protein
MQDEWGRIEVDGKESILIVDDDESTRRSLSLIFSKKGYEAEMAGTGGEAIGKAKERFFNLAFLDIKLPDMEGMELLMPLKELHPDMVLVMVTGHASLETALRALNEGASAYITKPLNMEEVLAKVQESLERQRLEIENRNLYEAALRELAERKRAEEKIKQAAEEWRATFDSIADLVSIHDENFKIVRVNKAFADVFKMEPKELISQICYEIFHDTKEPCLNCPLQQTFESKKPGTAEFFEPHLGIHLEIFTSPIFNERGGVVGVVHVARDITERKRMEEQFIITDRLASIGQLAAGVAHELNNPLTGVIGFSQLIMTRDIPDDIREDIDVIHRDAQRAGAVVKNLLTFSRKHAPVKKLVNVNGVIEDVLELRAYAQKASNIQVNTQCASDLPEIIADYFQLQQVVLNIMINAEHSMIEAHDGGTLTITIEKAGDVIKASFADDGLGITEGDLGHVFDPFFTTKEVGKGTGLGLSVCHGIISEHGGRIYAKSELGQGATFIVEFPINMTPDERGATE